MPKRLSEIDNISDAIAKKIDARTIGQTYVKTEIAGLDFYRQDAPTPCTSCVVEPSIAIVVQGTKTMTLKDAVFEYDRYRFLITSLDLPAQMQVTQAELSDPYLGLVLGLNFTVLSELMLQSDFTPEAAAPKSAGMVLSETNADLLDAARRLVGLLDEPTSIPVLAPLIIKEIYWRVLTSEQGARLRHMVSAGSQGIRIVKTIDWLKKHFMEPGSVEKLAEMAQMSKSTFHLHFRQLTSVSPLQYQKTLRLMEARRMMIGEHVDAAEAAYRVGYESPSQFSREYSRYFGNSPKRDVEAQWELLEQSSHGLS